MINDCVNGKIELVPTKSTTPTGKATWSRRAIDTLLSNEKYLGSSMASAARMSSAPHSKYRDRYLFQEQHEAIIDEIAAAEKKKRRSTIESDENGIRRKKTQYVAKKQVAYSTIWPLIKDGSLWHLQMS